MTFLHPQPCLVDTQQTGWTIHNTTREPYFQKSILLTDTLGRFLLFAVLFLSSPCIPFVLRIAVCLIVSFRLGSFLPGLPETEPLENEPSATVIQRTAALQLQHQHQPLPRRPSTAATHANILDANEDRVGLNMDMAMAPESRPVNGHAAAPTPSVNAPPGSNALPNNQNPAHPSFRRLVMLDVLARM